MKINNITRSILSVAVLSAITSSVTAAPIGTPAATQIDNTASISYSVGTTPQTAIESSPTGNSVPGSGAPTSFVVDKKIDLLVTGGDITNVVPSQTGAADNTELSFTVTNEGNSPENFAFTASDALAIALGDDFNTTNCVATPATATALPSGDDVTVIVECDIPASSATVINGTSSIVDLLAEVTGVTATTGADDPAVVDTVFADGTGTATDGTDQNALHSATGTYNILTAALTVTKTEAVVDNTFNFDDQGTAAAADTVVAGGFHIPGSTIAYTIEVDNTGAEASNVIISDPIDTTNLTFVSCTVAGAPAALVPAAPACTFDGTNVITAPFTLADGSTTAQKATITIQSTVN